METYHYENFRAAGLDLIFVQDNQSSSMKGVLRGLHYQLKHPQGKLVRAISGEIFDVVVDLRQDSKTFQKWFSIILSGDNHKQLYIPPGFAHGFLVLSRKAEIAYKCTDYYHPEDEGGIIWNDPTLGIQWPFNDGVIISDKDSRLLRLQQSAE